jgi:hypothetical protein
MGYDCQSCVDKGFDVVKKINSLYPEIKTYIIESRSNVGFDQGRNDYYRFVYNDKDELIRKELQFLATPILLMLSEENVITKISFPVTNSNIDEIIDELLKC